MNFLQISSSLYGTCPGMGRAGMSVLAHIFQTNLDFSSGFFQLVQIRHQICRGVPWAALSLSQLPHYTNQLHLGEKSFTIHFCYHSHTRLSTWSSPAQNSGLCCSKLISGLSQLFLLLGKGGVARDWVLKNESHFINYIIVNINSVLLVFF